MKDPDPLSSFRVRPRFAHKIALDREATREKILASLTAHTAPLEVKSFPEFIGLHIAAPNRHTWSPRLFLSFESTAEGGTRIEGIYGPEVEVWSLFFYGYLISGLLGTFSGILGGAQLFIGATPWGFWITGAMGLVALVLYFAAQIGQKLGAAQTYQLHTAYEAAVDRLAESGRPRPSRD